MVNLSLDKLILDVIDLLLHGKGLGKYCLVQLYFGIICNNFMCSCKLLLVIVELLLSKRR